MDLALAGVDPGQVVVDDRAGGAVTGANVAGEGGGRAERAGRGHGASPSTGGTRNMPLSAAGA